MACYSDALFHYRRRPTREVKVGEVGVGGENPIRVQSMTIADTMDTEAVVAETRALVEAGCEIVRITAPTIHHAENLKNIRGRLRQEGISVPLVADIHFTPQAAIIAADYVEKVRINPGNYADRKLFAVREYTDDQYQSELERTAEKFIPLVRKCLSRGVAMRIGTNHGSLSDRIMNRYGDTPEGMVESALEFVRIAQSQNYHDLILSMKASSPFIMITAYRLLAQRMNELGMDYPFHLGVTEAGEGEDGRIKSAIGIGSLLEDGIGDTIRVSLTEDSIHEIPVARALVAKFNRTGRGEDGKARRVKIPWNTLERERLETRRTGSGDLRIGGTEPIAVITTWDLEAQGREKLFSHLEGTGEAQERGDFIFLQGAQGPSAVVGLKDKIKGRCPAVKVGCVTADRGLAGQSMEEWDGVLFQINPSTTAGEILRLAEDARKREKLLQLRFPSFAFARENQEVLSQLPPALISLESPDPLHDYRKLARLFLEKKIFLPIHLYFKTRSFSEPALEGASAAGGLLKDGIGDSLEMADLPWPESLALSFNILQASRLRIIKAEFIACPSCGRTLFDLQSTTQRIKAKTAHLKGVKIAIMGCIVNGPGEMADADFGYVGGGPGKIHLYVGKDCVEKNIPTAIADEKLIDLIKSHGKWIEPPVLQERKVQ